MISGHGKLFTCSGEIAMTPIHSRKLSSIDLVRRFNAKARSICLPSWSVSEAGTRRSIPAASRPWSSSSSYNQRSQHSVAKGGERKVCRRRNRCETHTLGFPEQPPFPIGRLGGWLEANQVFGDVWNADDGCRVQAVPVGVLLLEGLEARNPLRHKVLPKGRRVRKRR